MLFRSLSEQLVRQAPNDGFARETHARVRFALNGNREEHVREMAVPVIAHRVVIDPQARFSGVTGRKLVEELLDKLPVPA